MLSDLASDIRHRLRAMFNRRAVERELDDELRFHLERETEKHVRAGMSADAAARQARLASGSVDGAKESSRDARGVTWVEQFVQDVRYANRTLRKTPAFTAVAVLSLGLGIGANTAIFSAMDAFLFRQLAVDRPNELVTLEQVSSGGERQYNLGYADLSRFRELRDVFSGVTGTSWAEAFNVGIDDAGVRAVDARAAHISIVTGDYFAVLGIRPGFGRLLVETDDGNDMGAHPVVVISDSYWQRRFDRAPSAIGGRLFVNGTPLTIVGVTPDSYSGDWIGWPTDFWVPSSMTAIVHPEQRAASRSRSQFKVIARLERDVAPARAQAAANVLYRRLQKDSPPGSGINPSARLELRSAANGYSPQRESFGAPLTILMVIVTVVLVIACANIANLLLVRASAREREIAVRLALGAGRGRIIRQLMTESFIIALAGGVLGLAIGIWGMSALSAFARVGPIVGIATNANPVSVDLDLHPNAQVFVFTILLCVTTCLVFGLVPAFRSSKLALHGVLGAAARRMEVGPKKRRGLLVVVQVALSLVLLVATGLFMRSLRNLERENLGFSRERLLLVWALPGHTGQQGPEIATLWRTVAERVSALPGVVSASVSIEGVLAGNPRGGGPLMSVEGRGAEDSVRVQSTSTVAPDFFATVGQRLVAGREFTRGDTDSAQAVVIINRALAMRLFGSIDAIGHRVRMRGSAASYTVVGVVSDAKHAPRTTSGAMVYYPPGQNLSRLTRGMCVLVRTAGPASAVSMSVRQTLAAIDPRLPILNIDTVDEQLSRTLFQERLVAALSIAFAALALMLSSVGLYGVVSFITMQRTKEIGVRMALGATSANVLSGMLRESLRMVSAGIAIGIVAELLSTRAVAAQLYGVRPTDAVTVVAASVFLLVTAACAAFLPARRASRLNPVIALRHD